jgi:signal transduction histidine kinase
VSGWAGGPVSGWAGGPVSGWAGGPVSGWAGGPVSGWLGAVATAHHAVDVTARVMRSCVVDGAHTRICPPIIDLMWPTGYVPQRRGTGGSGTVPIGPAMTTLRSIVAYIASMVRCAGIVYIVVQVVIWHSFYTVTSWRLTAPALAVAWAVTITVYLRRRWPSRLLTCADSAVYVALALGAQACVPPAVRDDTFSWLVISMSGQLMVPAWYAPGALSAPLALISPMAYWAGAVLQPVTDRRTLTGAAILLIIIGLVHGYIRRVLYGRAAVADAALDAADQAASEQYAILSRNIERREHERLLHDTVLNTLTALTRAGRDDVAEVVNRCRRDVALIEGALGDPGDLAAGARRPSGDLLSAVRDVVADMRARGLNIHVEIDDGGGLTVPALVVMAISNAAREALSNVAAHAGTGEAWVSARLTAPDGDAGTPCRLQVIVRDAGLGFDPARVDQARLGLRRSIAERIADCGGQASIWSEPGQGTVVCLSWPAPERPGEPDPVGRTLADRKLAQESLPW